MSTLLLTLFSATALADSPRGFLGDTYSFHHLLGAQTEGGFECLSPHMAGMRDNTVAFDGAPELLDVYTNGTLPFVFEFETSIRGSETDPISVIEIHSVAGDDLFPEGFVDPESGTPLTAACIEIGLDDTLSFEGWVVIHTAHMELDSDLLSPGPIDVSSAFPAREWDGRVSIVLPDYAGMDIKGIDLEIVLRDSAIFSDGFESGDVSFWTDPIDFPTVTASWAGSSRRR